MNLDWHKITDLVSKKQKIEKQLNWKEKENIEYLEALIKDE